MTEVDGATMHYGLEARSPFLDHMLWEFASGLPFGLRLRYGYLKSILRGIGSAADRAGSGNTAQTRVWSSGASVDR